MTRRLLELLRGHEELADLDPAARRLALRPIVHEADPDQAVSNLVELADWVDGTGPLSKLMRDPDVTDILVNGIDEVWVERSGRLQRTRVSFEEPADLFALVERLVGAAGGRADSSVPIADARLGDGSRLHVVMPPLAGDTPVLSIRRFPALAFSLDDLVERGLLSTRDADLLRSAVEDHRTIAVGGGTGCGKTTLVNALLGCISNDERVVLIEETPELRPSCPHWVSLVTRPPNVEGRGEIDQTMLLRAALRMRPDRIVVGEVRGAEASVALQAMGTGHPGSLVTVHARSASDVVERLVELALMDRQSPGAQWVTRQVERALDMVVFLERHAGQRRVAQIVEL